MTRHHPDSLSLDGVQCGQPFTEPYALCIRFAPWTSCAHCRSRVDTLNSLGAVMMAEQPKVRVSETQFRATDGPVSTARRSLVSPFQKPPA
jgi:hypothetical protein